MAKRMYMGRTRTGFGPVYIDDTPKRVELSIAWYAPKPAWMKHIPGPSLRFKHRMDFDSYMERTAR